MKKPSILSKSQFRASTRQRNTARKAPIWGLASGALTSWQSSIKGRQMLPRDWNASLSNEHFVSLITFIPNYNLSLKQQPQS